MKYQTLARTWKCKSLQPLWKRIWPSLVKHILNASRSTPEKLPHVCTRGSGAALFPGYLSDLPVPPLPLSQCLWGRADSPPPTVLPSVSGFPKAPQIPAFPHTLVQHDPTTLFCQLYFPCLTSLEKGVDLNLDPKATFFPLRSLLLPL